MATVAVDGGLAQGSAARAAKAMRGAAVAWFAVALAGQAMFAAYIAALYGRSAAAGDWAAWNRVMPHGLVDGDWIGNAALGFHLLLAFVVTVGGPLQLVPQVRRSAPRLHRWNGRIYLAAGFIAAISGLVLVWSRSGFPGWSPLNGVAISFNAVAILACGAMALRYALRREFAAHRRWALRLFLVMSGVWFLRIFVMLWALAFGPAGLGTNLSGPVGIALTFAQVLLPLGVLELYLRAETAPAAGPRRAVAAVLAGITAIMAVGIAVATLGMWLPHM